MEQKVEDIATQCFVDVHGLKVSCWKAGESGSAIVLLHGGGVDSALLSWREAIPVLAKTHRIFAPDLPGYGDTAFEPGMGKMDQYPIFMSNLLDALGLPTTSLVGISLGGGIALNFTLDNPKRVEKLVLADSLGIADRVPFHFLSWLTVKTPGVIPWSYSIMRSNRASLRWGLASIFGDPSRMTESLVDEVQKVVQRKDTARAFYELQKSEITPTRIRACYMDRLGEIHQPTLIVHGSKDRLVPVKYAIEASKKIPNARLEIIEGAGHWPMRERPEEFNKIVEAFFL